MTGLVHPHDHGSGSRLAAMEGGHFWFAGRDLLVRELLRRHDVDPTSVLLDLGSGTGRFARDLADTGRCVVAVDPSPGTLGPVGATFAARGEQLPLRDGSVGVVLARDVLEHVDDVAALAECARVLRPGGVLVVLVPAWPALWSDRDVRAGHLRRYRRAEVRDKVAAAGLDVVEQRGYQLALLPAIVMTRLASRVGGPAVVDREERPPPWLNALLPTPAHRVVLRPRRAETTMTCEPFLFHSGAAVLAALARDPRPGARPAAVVIDWERRDKERRQRQASMSIGLVPSLSHDTYDALPRVRHHLPGIPVVCRIDGPGDLTGVDAAVTGGASEVLVPMVRHEHEVDVILEHARGRVGVGVMVETVDAVERIDRLVERPVARAYVGLVDLALQRGTASIFAAFHDGVVDHVAHHVRGRAPFGVGGLTLPGHGHPVPARSLAGEIVRVGGDFSFLRRSFLQHLGDAPPGDGILAVREMLAALEARSRDHVARDHLSFSGPSPGRSVP